MNLFQNTKKEDNDQWMSISDMMSVMMFIFMIIAIIYARSFEAEPAEKCDALFKEIKNEFDEDFERWKVSLDEDLTIRFDAPQVQFAPQSYEIRPYFQDVLFEFWPRYIFLLKNHNDDIKEIRIEGHTSKRWGNLSQEQAYFKNMKLSQDRTRSILEYVFTLETATSKEWMRQYITANGLSSSQPEINEDGTYSPKKSRRVEFRSISKACLKAGKQQ